MAAVAVDLDAIASRMQLSEKYEELSEEDLDEEQKSDYNSF